MHLLQYICMSVRVFVCLSLLSFHFTLQSLTQKWKIFLSLIKSVNLSHLVWEKCDHQLSLCSASNFLTLSIPFHIELLHKFVYVTPWELREHSAWWVTWNFYVIPFSRSVSQSLSCMETFVITHSHYVAPSKAVRKCHFSLTL